MSDPKKTNDDAIRKDLGDAVELAAQVATKARRQWAGYKDKVVTAAAKIESAAGHIGGPDDAEKELMAASVQATSSMAEVFINFADAAFEAMRSQGEPTRRKAADLARKVIKLAVDDVIEDETRVVQRTTRMIELRPEYSWQTIYLPRGTKPRTSVVLTLKGSEFGVPLQVRAARNDPATLTAKDPHVKLELVGSRPSLSIRIDPTAGFTEPCSGLLLVSGDYSLTLSLLGLPDAASAQDGSTST